MWNNFKKIGDIVFDYVIISLLLTVSLLLLIPFIPMYIGVNYYFSKNSEERSLKDIFICIKNNFGIICKFTILEVLILVFSIGNILFFNTGSRSNDLITLLSYVFLIFGVIFFVNSSIIINNMNVTLKQLLFNCITFIFGKWYVSLILIALVIAAVIGLTYFPYLIPFALYFIAIVNQKTNGPIFNILKAKQMKTTVNEMLEQENRDDYYDK